MEKCLTWYVLSLKQNMKKPAMWVLLASMLLLLGIFLVARFPDGTNRQVAICYNNSNYSSMVKKNLDQKTGSFVILECEDEETVIKLIESGEAECGFVFSKQFDKMVENGEWKNMIRCYTSSFAVKSEVAKEQLYAAIFPLYGQWLLTETQDEIYAIPDEERLKMLLEKNEEYVSGGLILDFEEITVGDATQAENSNRYLIQALVELFVLLTMLLSAGGYGQKETAQISSALFVSDKPKFVFMNLFASASPIALAGLCVVLLSPDSRGLWMELFYTLSFLCVGAVGVMCFSKLFKNRLTYLAWITTVVICFMLLRFGIASYITH